MSCVVSIFTVWISCISKQKKCLLKLNIKLYCCIIFKKKNPLFTVNPGYVRKLSIMQKKKKTKNRDVRPHCCPAAASGFSLLSKLRWFGMYPRTDWSQSAKFEAEKKKKASLYCLSILYIDLFPHDIPCCWTLCFLLWDLSPGMWRNLSNQQRWGTASVSRYRYYPVVCGRSLTDNTDPPCLDWWGVARL